MRYLSVCSGIEAATMAWHPLGWSAVAFSEVDAFPCAVLAHHYPTVPNWGDMTKFQEWPDADVDVLVGGTPCQSFSVAGLRKGLADPRGNLMLTYLAIADRYRPEWLVWENVPGVLSSNGGRDFGTFLGGLGELGYGFAYRVLDAQYVRVESHPRAVPQRRRRVFVVGNSRSWRRAAAVLFERESLCGHPPPRRETRERTPASVIKGAAIGREPSAGPQFGEHLADGSCYTLNCTEQHAVVAPTSSHDRHRADVEQTLVPVAFSCKDHGADAGDVAPTLRGMGHDDSHANGGGQLAVAFAHQVGGKQTTLGYSDDGTVQTLGANQTPAVMTLAIRGRGDGYDLETRSDGTANAVLTPSGGRAGIGVGAVAIQAGALRENPSSGPDGVGVQGGIAYTLEARAEVQAVAFAQNQRNEVRQMDVAGALAGEPGMKQQTYLQSAMQVRRLTPRECERLQGFPDDYTLIPYRGKPAADGPRYKALGNSMVVNCMSWIGERIAQIAAITEQERAA